MARYTYDRLTAQDASFLFAERENHPMHVGAVAIFEADELRREDGGVDVERLRRAVDGVLHWIPRYRQKLQWIPLEGWPVWVDDRQFDLGYHIRHIALPKPGRAPQLKELAGRIHSRPLDRRHPLWEMWLIEGVEGGEQFALLNKIHHCMIDGVAGADLAQILFSPSPRAEIPEPLPYLPRPAPSRGELLRDSVSRAMGGPLRLARGAALARRGGAGAPRGLERRLRALGELAGYALRPASATPINGELGPHRRVEWMTMPLDDVLELRKAIGCTVNDLVLATVAGAMRRYLFRHRVDHRSLDFRVAAPVSTRRDAHDRRQGNHVSTWIVPLPLHLDDPLERLAAIGGQTKRCKESEAALAIETVMQLAEWLPAALLTAGVELANGPANMIVTNVPGPQFPLYSVGARLLGMYPLVPLLPGGGLGVALFSYEGRLCWGFNGDYELVRDLPMLVEDARCAFEELRGAIVSDFVARRTAEHEVAPVEKAPRPRESVRVEVGKAGRGRRARAKSAGSSGSGRNGAAPPEPARAPGA